MELTTLKPRTLLTRSISSQTTGQGGRTPRKRAGDAIMKPALNNTFFYNDSNINSTFDTDYLLYNATELPLSHGNASVWFCAKWSSAQQDLYQISNLCFTVAFLAPKSFKQSILVMRALAAIGALLMAMWGGAEVCAPDILAWSLALLLVNSVHTTLLVVRFLPPSLSLELTELYLKLFKPFKVSKKHFQELTKEARIMKLDPGEAYAVEEVTPADERFSILIKGKMRVSCDETHLHFIQPYQFVDSPEWEANREQSDDVFQVTIIAEESCTCVCWPRMRLERVLRHRPAVKMVLDCLIGKDITHKLYSVSEGLNTGAATADLDAAKGFLSRSASVDAVHEGSHGRLRSTDWRAKSLKKPNNNSTWQPMIARQFLRNSPFSQSVTHAPPPKLLQQKSSSSLQVTPIPKSPRKLQPQSSKKSREVKFAEYDEELKV